MKPALGPDWWEEWETQNGAFGLGFGEQWSDAVETVEKGKDGAIILAAGDGDVVAIPAVLRHATAALCLHGQEFGFWPELPKTLRIAAEKLRVLEGRPDDWVDLERAADLIAALLPPEEK